MSFLKRVAAKTLQWKTPNLAKEYMKEKGFFDVWEKELKVAYPTQQGFVEGAKRYGKVETIENSKIQDLGLDFKLPGDYYAEQSTVDWLKKTHQPLEMPIVFKVRDDNYIVFSGRHRIGFAVSEGYDLQIFVIPYPKKGQELYSPRILSL